MTLICENWKSQVSVHGAWCKSLVSVHDWMVQCIAAWWATIAIGALVAIGGIGACGEAPEPCIHLTPRVVSLIVHDDARAIYIKVS